MANNFFLLINCIAINIKIEFPDLLVISWVDYEIIYLRNDR
ncbi:hypothetical protein [Blochmannia endosymbiont of Camponotus sp.]|nr:hypothetical protein [Blochmannia endosymbiont of Camponotus sp.]